MTWLSVAWQGTSRILKGEEMGLKEIEVEAFGRRSRATVVERCAYDPAGERVRN
ncbi:hypothetical protein N7E70_028690 (plasmid) [Aminobacter sp. NyZ550]|uniref:hypothetical protein n=1 Tax=Aminobacter sp. NyZ550 TaxID=2979870 RepID=UPI0021D5D83F|nr:hypothetical protein [Aminobacter sp. NyZ550]WAX98094.1 hypothetical protein N7E70_028690 [Aminobacter sp. NyZ550]